MSYGQRMEQADADLRKQGHYSHLISFRLEGRYRSIICHARHVPDHMHDLIPFANRGEIQGLKVEQI